MMSNPIRFDGETRPLSPILTLHTKSGHYLATIPAYEIQLHRQLNDADECSFSVDKFQNGKQCTAWSSLQDFKLVYSKEWGEWFEIETKFTDKTQKTKSVTGTSLGEAELSQIMLFDIEINTEDDIARDDYVVTTLYDPKKPKGSLLHRITEKAPHYAILHVDASLQNIQRMFSWDNKSILDAFNDISEELDCLFQFSAGFDANGALQRYISVYDLESYCPACGKRGEFADQCPCCGNTTIHTGYGNDTTIYTSRANLTDEITFEVDTDAVKNVFRLQAGDELMTATVRNCNPNGTAYIWYLQTQDDMSDQLKTTLSNYDKLYNTTQNSHEISLNPALVSKYNALVSKYSNDDNVIQTISSPLNGYSALMTAYYDTIDFDLYLEHSMMSSPALSDTNAIEEIKKLTPSNLSPVAVSNLSACSTATAENAVISMCKVLVDTRYQIRMETSNFDSSSHQWTGTIRLTNYSDDEDTAITESLTVVVNNDYTTFVKHKLDRVLNEDGADVSGIVEIFKKDNAAFAVEMKKYGLASLNTFYEACQACLTVMIQQCDPTGLTNVNGSYQINSNIFKSLYASYYQKSNLISAEIKMRESEIAIVAGQYNADEVLIADGMQTELLRIREKIQKELNLENYLGEELWKEFSAYRREDEYSNDNYISDGLNNAELFRKASEFIEVAQKDIVKSATRQHSISANLYNLLVIPDFKPLVDSFKLGNWMRIQVDEEIYKLRLIEYTIDYDDLTQIDVGFSDVIRAFGVCNDLKSLLAQASSMATSYESVKRQASQGEESNQQVKDWINYGLDLTQTNIVNDARNQDIVFDGHRLLCRERIDGDTFDDRQMQLINRGMYYTTDNWATVKTGFGEYMYYDPADGQTKVGYGVIADTIVGNIILSKNVGVYTQNGSMTMDENGLVITADSNLPNDSNLFTIQKKSGNSIAPILTVSKNGQLKLVADGNGSLIINTSNFTLDANGNATFKGDIKSGSTITGATISGTTVNGGTINGTTITGASGEFTKKFRVRVPLYEGANSTGRIAAYFGININLPRENGNPSETAELIYTPVIDDGELVRSYVSLTPLGMNIYTQGTIHMSAGHIEIGATHGVNVNGQEF